VINAFSEYKLNTTTVIDSNFNLSNIATVNSTTTSNSGLIATANIHTTDRVGIKTSTPAYELDVSGDINASTNYRMGTQVIIDNQYNLNNINTVNSTTIENSGVVNTSNIYTSGNVGIGKTTANYTLDVNGDINAFNNYYINGHLIIDQDQNLYDVKTINATTLNVTTTSNSGTITTRNLNTTGIVGINTIAPGFTLDTTGEINASSNYRVGGRLIVDSDRNLIDIQTINSTTLSNSGTARTDILYTTGNVGIHQTSAAFTLDVNGDINASSTYKMGGVTLIDNNCNLGNISTATVDTLNSRILSNTELITTCNLTVTGTITGSIVASQVSDLTSVLQNLGSGSATSVTTTVETAAQASITNLINVTDIGCNVNILTLGSANTIISGSATIVGMLTASNLTVLGTTTIINSQLTENSNLIINNQSIAGTALTVNQIGGSGAGVIADFNNNVYNPSVPILRINENGSIGINTISKDYALSVNGTGYFSSNLIVNGPNMIIPVGDTSSRPANKIQGMIRYNTTTNSFEGVGYNTDWTSLGGVTNTAQSTYITANENNTTSFYNNSAQSMIILENGKIGMGNTAPSYKLDVTGDINATNSYLLNGNTIVDSGKNLTIANITSSGTVTTTGSVGIGNTAPSYKLDVTGDINATSSYKMGSNTVIDFDRNLQNIATVNSTDIANSSLITTSNLNALGRVGINKTGPGFELDVYGVINASTSYNMGNTAIIDSSRNLLDIATINSTTLSNSGTVNTQHLYTSDSVGINKTSASYTLDVNGDVNSTSNYRMGGTVIVDSSRNLNSIATINSTTLSNSGAARTQLLYTTSNVAISKEYADYALDVNGDINASDNFRLKGLTVLDSNYNLSNIASINVSATISTTNTSNSGLLATNTLNTTGRVGIEMSAPRYSLDVNGDINALSSYRIGETIIVDSNYNLSNIETANTTTTSNSGLIATANLHTTNRVGIQMSAPAYALDVSGDINATVNYRMGGEVIVDSSRNFSNIATINTTTITNSGTINTTNFYTSGSVGINQTSASHTLDVSGDINATSTYKMGGITILDSSCNLSNIATINVTTTSNSGLLATGSINTTNNVGIRMSSPTVALDVLGDINATSTYKMGGVTIIDASCNLNNLNTVNSVSFSNSGTTTTNNLYTSGSVGINKSSAAYTLDVNGDINTVTNYKVAGATVIDSNLNITSSSLSNSGTVNTQNLYTSSSVGVNKATAGYTLDVNGDINASSNYYMGGTVIVDSSRNLSNIVTANATTVNSSTLSNTGLITTCNLTVTGLITGSIVSSQVTDLIPVVSESVTSAPNITSISSNVYTLNINSANTVVNGNQSVNGNFTASNLLILGTATIVNTTTFSNSNVVINNQSVSGTAFVINQLNTLGDNGVIADFNDIHYNPDVPVFRINEAGTVGINTTSQDYTLNVNGTGYFSSNVTINGPGFKIPVGDNAARPANATSGMIRYNSEISTFEGYGPGNAWGSLGGVINTARSTYVQATESDTIIFQNSNSQSMIIDASGHVGVGTTPTYAMDVANDVNTWATYKLNGRTVIDNSSNLVNINNATVEGLIATSNLTVYGTITGTMQTNQINGLESYVVNTYVINSSNTDTVTTTVSSTAQNSITNLNNVVSLGSNVSYLNIGATQSEIKGSLLVNTLSSSNLVANELSVFGTPIFGSNLLVSGDAQIGGTLYAGKIRLGTLYSTTTVNGTLAASLSIATQRGITQLNTVTVDNLTATNSIVGSITGNAATATTATSAGSAGYVTFPSQPNITSVGTLSNLTVASNITAQSLTLGSFTFTVPTTNKLQISYNGSNIYEFTG